MKRKVLKIAGILSVIVLILSMLGCSTMELSDYDSDHSDNWKYDLDNPVDWEYSLSGDPVGNGSGIIGAPAELPSSDVPDHGGRKVIQKAGFTAETREFLDYITQLKTLLDQVGGYVESESQKGREPYRTMELTVRVPQERFLTFLSDASENVTVSSSWQDADDVTTEYFDTEAWIEVYTAQRERILELIAQASTIEELIRLEQELTRINYEIESLTTTLRQYDSLISYSTVTISVIELAPAEAASTGETLGARISLGFKQSLENTGTFFEELLYILVVASPALVITGVIIAIVLVIVHFAKKRKKAKLPPSDAAKQ